MLVVAVLPLLLWMGCVADSPPRHLWQEIDAPGGKLRIEYADPPAFGSHTLYFSYLPNGASKAQTLGTRELNNDGANLGAHNLEIRDRSEQGMLLVLKGQQQENMSLVFWVIDGKAELKEAKE